MEEYREYCENVAVSNLGNVIIGGIIAKQYIDEYYYYVIINGVNVRVHTMVGRCFPEICGEHKKYYHYHHVNGNQLDNRAENIICISPSEHKRIHQIEDGVSIGVKAFDKELNKIGEWESKTQASEETGVCYRHITNIINGKERRFTAGGYYWFKNDVPDDEIKNKIDELKANKNKGNRGKKRKNN